MIHINFDPGKLEGNLKEWFDDWEQKSEIYTDEIIENWETGKDLNFRDNHWGKLKEWLLKNFFYGKCAYCETKSERSYEHAEHFRPKKPIVNYKDPETKEKFECYIDTNKLIENLDLNYLKKILPEYNNENDLGQIITSIKSEQIMKLFPNLKFDEEKKLFHHPGYFWLAYNWRNLLPSCIMCNTGEGKQNQFPTKKGNVFFVKPDNDQIGILKEKPIKSNIFKDCYYLLSKDLDDAEEPLLLHPYFTENINDHLTFGTGGIVCPIEKNGKKDKSGQQSILVYNLMECEIIDARIEAQERFASKIGDFVKFMVTDPYNPLLQKTKTDIEKYLRGEAEYSASATYPFKNNSFLYNIFKSW